MKLSYEIFVVLAPAIVISVVGFVVEVVPVLQRFVVKEIYISIAKLEWLKEVVSHSSFYGVAVSGFLGYNQKSPEFYLFAVAWFLACQWFSIQLVARVEAFEEEAKEKEKIRFRKTAGMVRSIVKDELGRHTLKNWSNSES